ncbi:MAG: Calx-beta domain-containing protein, partial [Paracoccaceae bacterium]
IALEIVQFATPGQFDSISVGGIATLDLGALDLTLPGGAPAAAGSTMDLITATGDLSLTGVDFTAVLINRFGSVPGIGATTLNGQVQGYLLADTGTTLQLQALGADPSGPAGEIDFGAATLTGVDLKARNGFGAGTGGGYDSFALFGVSSVAGTAGADTIILETTSNVTVSGRDNNDILVTGSGDDNVDGGLGDDVIQAGLGTNAITTGGGLDLIVGSAAELDGDTVTDISGDESFAVRNAAGIIVAATIEATAGFITIDIGGDGSVEATLINGSGFVGTLSSFTGPDPIPAPPNAVSVQGAGFFVAQVNEGDVGTTPVTFTVVRSGDLSEDLIVDYAVAGSGSNPADGTDFAGGVLPTGQVTILAGQASADVTVQIAGDNDNTETNEDFSFTITSAVTGSGGSVAINDPTAFARILDDDVLRISVSDAPDVFETTVGGTTELIFTVFRVGDPNGAVTVNYSLTGGPVGEELDLLADSADVVGGLPQAGSVVLADGQVSAQVIVQIVGDDQIEPREDVTITLTDFSVDGGPAQTDFVAQQATGTILNDDGQPPVIPPGLEADVFGDPHLVTLDGLGYDFQAVGEFTLFESSGGTNPSFNTPLEVQIRTAPVPGSDLVSVNVAMATMIGASEVMIDVFAEPKLLVDGIPTAVPPDQGFINVGDGQVFFDGAIYTIVYATGEQVKVEVFD